MGIQYTNLFKRYRTETIFRTYGTGRTGRRDNRDALCPLPNLKCRGHKTSGYGQEMYDQILPQSHTTDQPTVPQGRDTGH